MGTLYFWAYRLQIGTNRNSGRNQEVAKLGPPPNRTSIGNILAWVCTVPNVAYSVNLENSLKNPLSAQNGQFWAEIDFFMLVGQICHTFGFPKHKNWSRPKMGRFRPNSRFLPLCCKNDVRCKKNVLTWPQNQYFCFNWPFYVVNMGQNCFEKPTNKFSCQMLHNLTAWTILLNKIFVKNDFIIAKFSQKAEFVGFINVRCLIKSPEW